MQQANSLVFFLVDLTYMQLRSLSLINYNKLFLNTCDKLFIILICSKAQMMRKIVAQLPKPYDLHINPE